MWQHLSLKYCENLLTVTAYFFAVSKFSFLRIPMWMEDQKFSRKVSGTGWGLLRVSALWMRQLPHSWPIGCEAVIVGLSWEYQVSQVNTSSFNISLVLFLSSLDEYREYPLKIANFTFAAAMYEQCKFSTSSSAFGVVIIIYLSHSLWWLVTFTAALICISLMAKDVEHISMRLLPSAYASQWNMSLCLSPLLNLIISLLFAFWKLFS